MLQALLALARERRAEPLKFIGEYFLQEHEYGEPEEDGEMAKKVKKVTLVKKVKKKTSSHGVNTNGWNLFR